MVGTRKNFQKFYQIEFAVKVVAAFSALIPFLGALVSLKENLKDKNDKFLIFLNDPKFFTITCFGVAYAACSDVSATAVAVVLALYLLSLGKEEALHGKLTFGYDSLLKMNADEAVRELKVTVPAMRPVVVKELNTVQEPGRIQLLVDDSSNIKAYRLG